MFKRLVFFFLLIPFVFIAQVGINTTTPSTASVLDVNSSNDGINFGGFMPPRVSLAERNSINPSASDDGLMVFLIEGTTRCVQLWNGIDSTWDNVYCMPVNQAPVANNVLISGTFQVGEIITANFDYTDAENDPAGTHTYIWYQADDAIGTNQIQIGTSSSFTLTISELNKYIAVEVTPVATSGTSPGVPALSIYNGPIINPSTTASDLFISEYVEGSGNNKVIEIANFTGANVDLSNYQINIYSNGNNTPSILSPIGLGNAILSDGDVYVITDPSAASPCNINVDQTNGGINFNGNDVVELETTSNVRVDIIGTIGNNNNFAIDVTLRKKTGVGPNINYSIGDYDSYPVDTCDDIGSHTY